MQSSSRPLSLPPDRKVLLCVGPGGVGKTTVAAALGLVAADAGRRTIVVTIDPSFRLAQALGVSGPAGARAIVTVPGTAESGHPLDCLLLDTKLVFDEIVRGYSPNAAAAERMLENPIYLATVQHLGGALEYAAIARVHMLVQSGRYDLIVLDTPPTANAIEFLEAPGRIAELLDNPAAKLLAGSGRVGAKVFGFATSVLTRAFETLGGGPFIGQLGEFLADFGSVLGEFQRRAGDVAELLVSRETGVVLSTSATEFSAREARAFLGTLLERRLRIDGVVLNRVDPPLPPLPPEGMIRDALAEQLPGGDLELALAQVITTYGDARVQSEHARAVQRELERTVPGVPVCAVPRRHPPPNGLGELREIGRVLRGA